MDSRNPSYYIVIDEDHEETMYSGIDERTLLLDILDLEEGDELLSYYGPEVLGAYKRVDRRVKPVPGVFPEDARVERRFPEDPLLSLPPLSPHPPEFTSGERLTEERLQDMKINEDGFLWPEEEKLFAHILKLNEQALAFQESHRGTFREDYFTPYIIPVVPHEPWEFANIPIPPGIKEKVIALLKEKIGAGVYEPSQSSYRSRWFCVVKKNGKLRIVHDLQPLNKVTIRDAGLPPKVDEFVEDFAARKCYTAFDLFWGFDARKVHPTSRDMTSFQTPLGLLRITSLPMGFTNSPAEFQKCMAFILQDEIPTVANIFIDDLPIKGPKDDYVDEAGNHLVLKDNPGIRRFVWEHAQDVHRIMHRVKHAGATFAPNKAQICRQEVIIVGQKCTPEGRLPEPNKVDKILNWPILKSVHDIRAFLGLCGTVRIWILNYSKVARPLTQLLHKDTEFQWTDQCQQAFDLLKKAVTSAPALRPIDYESDNAVVLAVDSSKYAVGFILSQYDDNHRKRPARYGSIPMTKRESQYSQPKLELYGLYKALRAYRLYLTGVKNLEVEVDAQYIKGMLNEPDLQPNATINRWIQGVLLFTFKLIHVPADKHKGPDALSRRPLGEGEQVEEDDDSWLDDIALYYEMQHHHNKLGYGQFTSLHTTISEGHYEVYISANTSADKLLHQYQKFLSTLEMPPLPTQQAKRRFIKAASKFFIKNGKMYKRNSTRPPRLVILTAAKRLEILIQAHEGLGHRGEQAVMHTVKERFYWPHMWNDIRHHVQSCKQCQIRSTKKVEVPIMVSTPATIFIKLYLDIMDMPKAKGFKAIIAARDDLSRASEGRSLKSKKAKGVAAFFFEQILCRYGAVGEVVTDNGPEFKEAFQRLMKRYKLPQIKISSYNSKANGVVERGHFIIRESILKTCEGHVEKWPDYVHHAFFTDRITISQSTGFSPYYLLYGVEPILPFDLTEMTLLVEGFYAGMSTADLLALRIRQLRKKPEDIAKAAALLKKTRFRSKEIFERRYKHRLRKNIYKKGELVLVRNKAVESSADRKQYPRYLGPFQIIRQTKGGSYVVAELDGAIWRKGVAAFRLLPFISRQQLEELNLADWNEEEQEIGEEDIPEGSEYDEEEEDNREDEDSDNED